MPSHKTIRKINYHTLDSDINNLDFNQLYNLLNVNQAANYFIKSINRLILANTILKNVPNCKRTIKPWITSGLLRCMKNRDNLHQKLKSSPNDDILKTTFKRYRNYCSFIVKKAKSEFEKCEFQKAEKIVKNCGL